MNQKEPKPKIKPPPKEETIRFINNKDRVYVIKPQPKGQKFIVDYPATIKQSGIALITWPMLNNYIVQQFGESYKHINFYTAKEVSLQDYLNIYGSDPGLVV